MPIVPNNFINAFPGYEYKLNPETNKMENVFRGEKVGKGGFVWARPGIYLNVVCLDVSGLHPASAIAMNYFGEYTSRYKELRDARLAIKKKDFETAKTLLNGALAPYLENPENTKALAGAIKLILNSAYGESSANHPNAMRDERNVNNIIALRGALFMVTLRDEMLARGARPIHIKTDSIKLVDPSQEDIDFAFEFAGKYGYEFAIEHKFDRIALVNDAVYVAKLSDDDPEEPGQWTATGAQFAEPYVFKTLFTHEPIEFRDMCTVFNVSKGCMYLDMNEEDPSNHAYHFVGRTGLFAPIRPGMGGGELMKKVDNKYSYPSGAKGYRWLESEMVPKDKIDIFVDRSYYDELVRKAVETISKFGDFEAFAGSYPPWVAPCGKDTPSACRDCSSFRIEGDKYTCDRGCNIADIILN